METQIAPAPLLPAGVRTPPNTVEELIEQVLDGQWGPPPSAMIVTYAFTTRSKSRHVGWANTYANYAASLRVGATVGTCLFEPGSVSQDDVEQCCTKSLEELLAHPQRPIRIAALDAYLGEVFPHEGQPLARPYHLPRGTTTDKLRARAAGVMQLLDPKPGQYVAMIGVIGTMIEWLRNHQVRYALCDFDPQPPLSGDAVSNDMDAVLRGENGLGTDGILSTGMTIGNDGFDQLMAHARANNTPLVVYAQSGSYVIPRFLGNGVTGVSAEPYPFFWAHGAPSTVFHYHVRHLREADSGTVPAGNTANGTVANGSSLSGIATESAP